MRRKFGWNYRGCAHPGHAEAQKPEAWVINDDFHDPQNEETRGIKTGIHWDFPNTHAALITLPIPFPPVFFLPLVSCPRFNREALRLRFLSFSPILPKSGWHQFHARSHPISPHRRRRKCHNAPGARVRDQSSPSPPRYEFRLVSASSHDSTKPSKWGGSLLTWLGHIYAKPSQARGPNITNLNPMVEPRSLYAPIVQRVDVGVDVFLPPVVCGSSRQGRRDDSSVSSPFMMLPLADICRDGPPRHGPRKPA